MRIGDKYIYFKRFNNNNNFLIIIIFSEKWTATTSVRKNRK